MAQAQQKLASIQDLASEEHAKVITLQQENERLKNADDRCEELKAEVERLNGIEQEVEQYRQLDINPRNLQWFQANKEAIRHYLDIIPMLAE